MSEELKACPFCGEKLEISIGFDMSDVHCTGCEKVNATIVSVNMDELIAEMNTRPLEDSLQSELKTFKTAIREAIKEINSVDHMFDYPRISEALAIMDKHGLIE